MVRTANYIRFYYFFFTTDYYIYMKTDLDIFLLTTLIIQLFWNVVFEASLSWWRTNRWAPAVNMRNMCTLWGLLRFCYCPHWDEDGTRATDVNTFNPGQNPYIVHTILSHWTNVNTYSALSNISRSYSCLILPISNLLCTWRVKDPSMWISRRTN
jgi:hypothetical protein